MSRYFVNDPPVAVPEWDASEVISDTPPNVIYIKSKMDLATDARVKSELTRIGDDNKTMELRLGDNQMALLIHNIVRWEGPDLGSVPCTPANIRALDPTEPHIALVLEEIARRNARKESPLPKSPTSATSASAGDQGSTSDPGLSQQLATSTPRLHSPNGSIGHQKSLVD
jgi:hypothetical protein